MNCILRLVQRETFIDEINSIKANNTKSKITNLAPFINSEGLLRVGGRLAKSNLSYYQKHPGLIP